MADITKGFDKMLTNTNINPFIIPQDEVSKSEKIKYYHIVFDSRERNVDRFQFPNKYELPLFEPINDVVSVELLSANIPFTRYLIHANNNRLHVSINGGSEQEYIIPEGNYEPQELSDLIVQQLGSTFSASINSNTNRITFKSSTPFSFKFKGLPYVDEDKIEGTRLKKDSIGHVIGFMNMDYDSTLQNTDHVITSPHPINLKIDDYIIMKLKNVNIYTGNSDTFHKAFAIICKNPDTYNINYSENLEKRLNPPLASLNRLRISFYDFEGNLYDFNNVEHRVELKIGTLKLGRRI